MIFKVKWGDLYKEFGKRTNAITSSEPPIKAYFETDELIYAFITLRGQQFYAEVQVGNIENLKSFKMEFLSDAFELLDNPLRKSFVLHQEIG